MRYVYVNYKNKPPLCFAFCGYWNPHMTMSGVCVTVTVNTISRNRMLVTGLVSPTLHAYMNIIHHWHTLECECEATLSLFLCLWVVARCCSLCALCFVIVIVPLLLLSLSFVCCSPFSVCYFRPFCFFIRFQCQEPGGRRLG